MTRLRLIGGALALVLLGAVLPTSAWAQGTFPYLVKIYGTPKPGSGFVVALKGDVVTIVTASHVIMGAQKFEVTFADAPNRRFAVDSAVDLVNMEPDEIHGLAAFLVRGVLPAGVAALPLDTATALGFEDDKPLVFVGFPNRTRFPRRISGSFGGRDGSRILFDRPAGEGASGSPLMREGKAVGLVTATDASFSYAVNAVVIRETLRGWNVVLGAAPPPPPPPPPPPVCRSGEEIKDNGIDFVRICAGTFTMGSADDDPRALDNEKPAHEVTLSEFWIGKYEVTNEQFRGFRPDHAGDAKLPAVNVSWTDAQGLCEYLGFQLPTEAQWEYAARAGTQTAWSFGNDESALNDYAWYGEELGGSVHPVGQKKPNPWGLYDMHGNAWEWVADAYGPYSAEPQTDPTGPSAAPSARRVLRGGSAWGVPRGLRSAYRVGGVPGFWNWGNWGIGFRCVRSPRRQP